MHPGLSGIGKRPISLDETFRLLKTEPKFINDYDITKDEDKEELNKILYTKYESETLDMSPTCECGSLSGEEYLDTGIVCNDCGYEVHHVTEKPVESRLWIKVPDGIEKFISPNVYRKLQGLLKITRLDTLRYLTDSTYRPKVMNSAIEKIESLELPRGLNNFYHNFDAIINTLVDRKCIPVNKRNKLMLWVEKFRGVLFTTVLPVPSKLVFVVEKAKGSPTMYADPNMTRCLEAVRTVNSIVHQGSMMPLAVKERNVVTVIEKLSEFYREYYASNMATRPGMFRKGLLGSRLDFTARAVASSMFDNLKREDECILPWGVACELFRMHIMSILIKPPYNMTPNEVNELVNRHVRKYHPLLDELFEHFVGDGHRTYCIVNRNPTLVRLAALRLRVVGIRKDPSINTIGIPILITKFPNCDFDGDELNVILLTDKHMIKMAESLCPRKGVFDLNTCMEVAGELSFYGPTTSTIANWLHN